MTSSDTSKPGLRPAGAACPAQAGERKAFVAPKEAKSQSPRADINRAMAEFFRGFEEFKEANDQRLAEIERKSSDVLSVEKVERINDVLTEMKTRIDHMAVQARRPAIGASVDTGARKAFQDFLRKGVGAQGALELKGLSGTSGPAGGYLIPSEVEAMIDRVLPHISPIRAIASVRQIGASVLKKPFTTTGAASGWVAETAARTETTAPVLAELDFPTAELYSMPTATNTLLDDSAADVEAWLAEEIQTVFAEQEGTAFVSGDGSAKPKGFLAYTTVADASWAWDKLGYIASGVDGAFAASNPSDALISLVYAPRQAYRANATWVMNRKTEAAIRKFRDAQGNYLWQANVLAGGAATLMGYPIVGAEDMPDIASNSYSVAFGDFRRGYLIVDRVGIRILRDPYSAKPYVLFYATKRVGGGIQDFAAIKLMKFAAS
jgi:HK97 family phage major capsid protein